MIYIGIDAGKNTGLAVWDSKKREFLWIGSILIHEALKVVSDYIFTEDKKIHVRVEDARQRTWFGNNMSWNEERNKLQGVGSVKRDCTIWDDFLKDSKVSYEMVPPKRNVTKLSHDKFQRLTGWEKRTNEHSRDAAMLVFGF